MGNYQVSRDAYLISTDKTLLDMGMIYEFLARQSTWSKGIPLEKVQASVDHSLNFGLYHYEQQIGYARVVSDYATVAYLGDVFILPPYRGKGLSKWLMEVLMQHPDLQGLRRWMLLTSDAHGLYARYGWKAPSRPETYMEYFNPLIYFPNQEDN